MTNLIKPLWSKFSDFDKHVLKTGFVYLIIFLFFSFAFPDISNSFFEWVSKIFSIPVTKDKFLGVDVADVIFLFFILLIVLSWIIKKSIYKLKKMV